MQNRQNSQNDCSMIIYNLRESDTQTYRFKFYTDGGDHTGHAGVTLTVTDLKITVSDTDSGGKKLICSSTCTLVIHYTYIWYRNGQPVYGKSCNELYLDDSTVDAGSYSCAVRGFEKLRSPAVYPPRLPSVSEQVSGDSTILACVSDSNPPSSYTWFYKTGSDVILVGNSSRLTLTAGEVGLFFCKAENRLGSYNSSDWLTISTENTAVKYAASGVAVVLLMIFIAVFLCMRRKRGAERDTHIQSLNPADDTYTALNLATISSDYDTLQGVKTLHSEQHTVMQRRSSADSADYENV
uniref:Ig-like domain-containing protein n=1 Tax=Astyanax mexicanus TaxID=7994 RepID=A0A8B9LKT0_ASTMX